MKRSVCFTALVKLLVVAMIATTLLAVLPVMNVSAADNIVITLDPGHGGADPGNQSAKGFGGNDESYDNWQMTLYAKERLEQYAGVTVYLTRDRLDQDMKGLDTRVQVAKNHNSDAIISIHTNSASNVSAGGIEILVPNQNWRPEVGTQSKACAQTILDHYLAETGIRNRGLKEKNSDSNKYADGSVADYYGIVKNGKLQNIPVVMIVETGFASNQEDYLKILQNDATRKRAGYAIADGLAKYYNLTPKAGEDMSKPEVPDIVVPEQPKTYKFWSSVDHVNGKGPNGAANFAGIGGNYNGGANTIDAIADNVYIDPKGKLTIGGWLGVDGGTARFVYSVDGGTTWMDAKGGYDGEPLPGHYAGLGFSNATKLGMFNNAKSPIEADLTAYAGDFVDVTFAAVSADDNKTVIPFITIVNYLVPGEKPVETTTEPETTTAEPETETTTEPEVTTVEPEETTVEPEVTTAEPEETTAEPEETTTVAATTPDTDAPAKESGCGSTVSGAMAIVALTAMAGACLVRKKKD